MAHRAQLLTGLCAIAWMLLAFALAQLSLPSPVAQRAPLLPRGSLRSVDGRLLAYGPLTTRAYPMGSLAAPVIGFVGVSGGLEGVERTLDDALTRGQNLTLTLDTRIQDAVESVLLQALVRTEAEYASAVVMDVRTGALRAMASVPGFDLNRWRESSSEQWRNRAALDEYEPGSVIKALTVAALVNEGRTTPTTRYDTPMRRRYAGSTINDIVTHPSQLTTQDILRYSSNVGMTRLVEDVPAAVLHRYFAAYGLGQAVNVEVPAGDGQLARSETWGALRQATISFGQGMTVTTLQLAAAFNILANDGRYAAPRLLEQVPPMTRPVLKAQTATTMRTVLQRVIDQGIRQQAEWPGYPVGGKTGTAQVVVDGQYSANVFSSTFAGFIPGDVPRYTVAVMVRGAKRDFQGSQLAAPIFRDVTSAVMSLTGSAPRSHP